MRLVEGISHPSRANDVQDLHRLQKSSTKPRQGRCRAVLVLCITPASHLLAFSLCDSLTDTLFAPQMTPVLLPLSQRLLDQVPERKNLLQ